eukprot:6056494-Prymnesium_polylepis.1
MTSVESGAACILRAGPRTEGGDRRVEAGPHQPENTGRLFTVHVTQTPSAQRTKHKRSNNIQARDITDSIK